MKYKSFSAGDTVKYWNPKAPGVLDCMDVRTGTIFGMVNNGKDYIIKCSDGECITMSTQSISESNGGHYCKRGPCWDSNTNKECEHIAKCRSYQ